MNLEKNWELKIDVDVHKDLSKFPKDYVEKILAVIFSFVENPYGGDIEKIKGEKSLWRRRVGTYRIFYEIYPELNLYMYFGLNAEIQRLTKLRQRGGCAKRTRPFVVIIPTPSIRTPL